MWASRVLLCGFTRGWGALSALCHQSWALLCTSELPSIHTDAEKGVWK